MAEKAFTSKPIMTYDKDCFVIPAAGIGYINADRVARFRQVCQDALIEAKMDRALELVGRIAATRSRPIPDAENAGPSARELMAQHQPTASDQARIYAEAEAAYAARNPHKKKETTSEDDSGPYKGEGKVTKPADYFQDAAPALSFKSRCQQSEAAYAARNPHKREVAR